MSQRIYTILTLAAAMMISSGVAKAESNSAFFGVGLTALAAKPVTPSGIIMRNAVYTPGAVAIGLSAQGYSQVSLLGRNPQGYLYSAISRGNGQHYLITVAAWRGEIVSAVRG